MERIRELQKANPQITIHDVYGPEFRKYGNYISSDTDDLCAVTSEALTIPESGSKYLAVLEQLDISSCAGALRETMCGQLDEQFGVCYGHSNQLNALEWHSCNEINVAVTDLVLFLAKRDEMDQDGKLDSRLVQAFYLHKGDLVEIYSSTLHFCPCEVDDDGFICVVGLQRGTNLPLEQKDDQEGKLWAKNKWLVAHEENRNLMQRGATVGIYGENWTLKTISK